ncbi:MAG: NUDIX hydrolase [Oscillospiraceae bacterium]|nr:NUDIX hydrolase [Oscillospiraceae bacterium]
MSFYEKTLTREDKFIGKIFTAHRDTVELDDGTTAFREIVDHHGGVGIVAIDEGGNVLLVRQYRYAYAKELVEIPAGKLEPGEDPIEAAGRELSEETGYSAGSLISLGIDYPTPGYVGEIIHIYLATDLRAGEQHLDKGEFLSYERLPFDEAVEMCLRGEINDSKTVMGILRAKRVLAND